MTSYKCSKCDYSRGVKGLVTQHITKSKDSNKEDHKEAILIVNIVKVQCEICNKEYDNNEALKTHRKRCLEKKAVVEKAYADPEIVIKSMSIFTELLRKYEKQIIEQNKKIETLTKRLEKLEGPEEPIEEDNDEENLCGHSKTIKFVPTSRTQIKTVLLENDCEDHKNVMVTIDGQRNLKINALVEKDGIEVDGVMYYYNSSKKEKSASELKVIVEKYCQNNARPGQAYCNLHTK